MQEEKLAFSGKYDSVDKNIDQESVYQAYVLSTENIKESFHEHSLSDMRFDQYFTLKKDKGSKTNRDDSLELN